MKSIEQTGPDGAGTVTGECRFVAGEPVFKLVVYPALLRRLPWFRGGRDVAAVVTGTDMTISPSGPHRLRARADDRLAKLPPVVLRINQMAHLRPAEQPETVLPYAVLTGWLVITLPEWARAPAASVLRPAFGAAGGTR